MDGSIRARFSNFRHSITSVFKQPTPELNPTESPDDPMSEIIGTIASDSYSYIITATAAPPPPRTANRAKTQDYGPNGSVQQLGKVVAQNLEVQVHVRTSSGGTGVTKITLREVPRFLINAFNFICEPAHLRVEGLFRKEGNKPRLNRNHAYEFLGEAPLDPDLTVIDVCVMVKRFLRDLKRPLIYGTSIKKKLFTLARRPIDQVTLRDITTLFEGERDKKGRMIPTAPLAPAHLGTLGFLMRQLLRIAQHSDRHQMGVENLAIIFGPTLFVGDLPPKKKGQDLEDVRFESQTHIDAVRLLILRADWIGLSTNHYVTSGNVREQRSASLAASPRNPLLFDMVNQPNVESKLLKRQSIKRSGAVLAKEETLAKVSKERRSSSTFRALRDLSSRVLRATSPSRRKEASADRRRTIEVNTPAASRVPGSPVEKFNLHFEETTPPRTAHESVVTTPDSGSSNRMSRSQHRRMVPRHPTPGPSGNHEKDKSSPRLSSEKTASTHASSSNSQTSGTKSERDWHDNPVSMLGEEAFNAELREQRKPPRRRRHTTPVKSTALRRNQPNTERTGLRRITTLVQPEHEKENKPSCYSKSSSSTQNDDDFEDSDGEGDWTLHDVSIDASTILEQKGLESRLRRAKNRNRSANSKTDSLILSGDTPLAGSRAETLIKQEKQFVNMATSPIVLTSNERTSGPLRQPGQATVTSMSIIDSPPCQKRLVVEEEDGPSCCPTSQATPTQITPVVDCFASVVYRTNKKVVQPDSPLGGTTVLVRSPPPPPLPAAGPPKMDNGQEKLVKRPSLKTQLSLDSQMRRVETFANASRVMPTQKQYETGIFVDSRPPLAPKPSFTRPTALSRRPGPSSASSLLPRSLSHRGMDDEFANSDMFKEQILASSISHPSTKATLEQRPSVAFIREKNHGMVRDRVHLFSQFSTPLETISGRSSAMSNRSSLGGQSVTSNDSRLDEAAVKASGPPVGHVISLGGSQRSTTSLSTSMRTSSPTSSPRHNHN